MASLSSYPRLDDLTMGDSAGNAGGSEATGRKCVCIAKSEAVEVPDADIVCVINNEALSLSPALNIVCLPYRKEG